MKEPPSIQPAPRPGSDYDPMDLIVENLQYIQCFLDRLIANPKDLEYLQTHLSSILSSRRTISQHLDLLSNDPYFYSHDRLQSLRDQNEKIFIYLEDVAGSMDPFNPAEFKKAVHASEKAISQFDGNLV